MRIDHHAYQRATRVAAVGLLIQIAIFLLLIVFGLVSHDMAFQFAAMFTAPGVLVWIGLGILFHQHKLERLEALEDDELAATRAGGTSVFERQADESRVAARRLNLMHKWLMPIVSLGVALSLTGVGFWLLRIMRYVWRDDIEFTRTEEKGWAVAICLLSAALCFIFSRYVAGMAKQAAWSNLRGGAAYMVGNALVLVAVAVGTIFRYFSEADAKEIVDHEIIEYIAYAIPIFMFGLAFEIVLNFILNLYRPRIPGEVPRPAFDSKVLSLFATPDSIVRSLNEAVNYQFGFDVTSSWGYQLLLRSFLSLIALGAIAMVLLSTMVIVEPHQQAIRLRGGEIIGDRIYESGIMWKLPWPIESAAVYDITPIRNLHLTAKVLQGRNLPIEKQVTTWDDVEPPKTDVPIDPFIVGTSMSAPRTGSQSTVATRPEAATTAPSGGAAADEERVAQRVSESYSLVDAEIVLQYRIRKDQRGLLDFLNFSTESVARRQPLTDRERALRNLALEQVSRQLSRLSIDHVLGAGIANLPASLRDQVQASFDAHKTGVEVVAVTLPMVRPSGKSAPSFVELGISVQSNKTRLAKMERAAIFAFVYLIGRTDLKDKVLAAIDEHDRLRDTMGRDAAETVKQRQEVERLLVEGGGAAAQMIANAERDRWVIMMNKKAQSNRVQSRLAAYRAAPRLYREREIMNVYKQYLPYIDKYFVGIDPSRIDVGVDLKKINSVFDFSGNSSEEVARE